MSHNHSPIPEADRRVSLIIPPYLLALAKRRARERGMNLSAYIRMTICADLQVPAPVVTLGRRKQ